MIDERASTYIWHDEKHKVRPGAAGSAYAGRYVVLGRREGAKRMVVIRHFDTADEAIYWCENHARLARREEKREAIRQGLPVPVSPSRLKPRKKVRPSRLVEQEGEMLRVFLPKKRKHVTPDHIRFPWVTSRFVTIRANPLAQVWLCARHEGEVKLGRRRADGTNSQTALPHLKGEFAVTWIEVYNNTCRVNAVRDRDGSVKVFKTIREAEFAADDLYANADEEDRMAWREGDKCVFRTLNIEVIFDPINNRADRPFSLWLPYYGKPIYENKTKITVQFDRSSDQLRAAGMSAQMLLDVERYREQQRQFSRAPAFSEYPVTYASMDGAVEAALVIERDVFKGRFLGFAGGGVGT